MKKEREGRREARGREEGGKAEEPSSWLLM